MGMIWHKVNFSSRWWLNWLILMVDQRIKAKLFHDIGELYTLYIYIYIF